MRSRASKNARRTWIWVTSVAWKFRSRPMKSRRTSAARSIPIAVKKASLEFYVAAGETPSNDELRRAREKLAAFYRRLVAGADREWERSHSYLFINDVERRAAHYLGLEKDWFYQTHETVECPGCGEKIKPGVAVCRTCGAILDQRQSRQSWPGPAETRDAGSGCVKIRKSGGRSSDQLSLIDLKRWRHP